MKNDDPNIGRLFSLSRDPVVCERGGIVTDMNPSAVELFGGDLKGHSLLELIPETVLSVEEDSFIAAVSIAGQDVAVTRTAYGEYRLYSFILPRVPDEQPFALPVSVSMREITNTIKVTAEQIMQLSEQYNDTKLDQYSAILKHSVNKLRRLMNNNSLLSSCMDGTQPFRPVMTDLNEMCGELTDAVASLAKERGIRVVFLPESDVFAAVDQQLFQTLLLNLISNSLIHTSSGGEIQIGLKASGTRVTLTVTDTGTGIPAQDLSTLFTRRNEPVRMETGRADAGLGLGVAEHIAKLHNGAVVVQSTPGKGTVVAVYLQRRPEDTLTQHSTRYRVPLSNTVMTELSTWLSWQDYLNVIDD